MRHNRWILTALLAIPTLGVILLRERDNWKRWCSFWSPHWNDWGRHVDERCHGNGNEAYNWNLLVPVRDGFLDIYYGNKNGGGVVAEIMLGQEHPGAELGFERGSFIVLAGLSA